MRLRSLLAATLVFACSSVTTDTISDAGFAARDAGTHADAGNTVDAGETWDAGLLADAGEVDAGAADAGEMDAGVTELAMPDFHLQDTNTASATAGMLVSPRDQLGHISGWYFAHAT
jgi:hypothetical protein